MSAINGVRIVRNSKVLLDSEGFDRMAFTVSNTLCLLGRVFEFEMPWLATLLLKSPFVPFVPIEMRDFG